MHDRFGTFDYVPQASVPSGTKRARPVIAFRYKLNRNGLVQGYKARCAYPCHRLVPGIQHDPQNIASHTAD